MPKSAAYFESVKYLSLLLGLLATLWGGVAFGAGHCLPDETTYFSCSIRGSNKIASVCGSNDRLQYRFGRSGQIELEFPKEGLESLSQFRGAFRFHGGAGVSAEWLMFDKDGTEYSVSQIDGGSNFKGVTVVAAGSRKNVDVHCDSRRPAVFKLHDAISLVPEGTP